MPNWEEYHLGCTNQESHIKSKISKVFDFAGMWLVIRPDFFKKFFLYNSNGEQVLY